MKNRSIMAAIYLSLLAAIPNSQAAPTTAPTTAPAIDLSSGWTLLQEDDAQGLIEQDARHPTNPSPHMLRINETKAAPPGEGRAGAVSGIQFAVEEGEWCDVTFTAATERASIGLVFSLESADGNVLARTTLPEIGGARGTRGGRGRGGPATATTTARGAVPWNKYLVSLHVRAANPAAHVVITPIETTNIWIQGLTLTPRAAAN